MSTKEQIKAKLQKLITPNIVLGKCYKANIIPFDKSYRYIKERTIKNISNQNPKIDSKIVVFRKTKNFRKKYIGLNLYREALLLEGFYEVKDEVDILLYATGHFNGYILYIDEQDAKFIVQYTKQFNLDSQKSQSKIDAYNCFTYL